MTLTEPFVAETTVFQNSWHKVYDCAKVEGMKCNVSKMEQAIRLTLGLVLIAWAVAGGPGWAWIGLIFLATGAWRFCPLYLALGINKSKPSSSGRTRETP